MYVNLTNQGLTKDMPGIADLASRRLLEADPRDLAAYFLRCVALRNLDPKEAARVREAGLAWSRIRFGRTPREYLFRSLLRRDAGDLAGAQGDLRRYRALIGPDVRLADRIMKELAGIVPTLPGGAEP
jgi:hypothetical protein